MSDQSKPNKPSPVSVALWETTHAITDSVGRRGVHIYGLPREQLAAVAFTLIFVGIPLFGFLSMMPIWDHVGELSLVSRVNTFIAPAINSLDYNYRAGGLPRFPVKRFVVAAITITEFLFLTNFASLFPRRFRKHALLVWMCFDHAKIFLFLLVSGLVFAGEWYVLFYDWRVLQLLQSSGRPGGRVMMLIIFSIPSVTLVFGHLTAIATLGICRATSKRAKLLAKHI
jgi:hypothetical protein